MSFQTIIDIHQSIAINNRRMVGQTYSRSGQITVAQYLTTVPWVFTVVPHKYLSYADSRNIIQSIDNADRQNPQYINFSSANLQWFTEMRGTATTSVLATTPAANTQTLTLSSNGNFKAGDFISINGYVYKVTANSAGTVVNIHRPLIGSPTAGTALVLGSAVEFYVIAEQCPTYTLTPMKDTAFVEWNGEFVFREYITG
jgi:hypothetical protein